MSSDLVVFDQWYLPPGEQHLQRWMTKRNTRIAGRLTYQYEKYAVAIALCPAGRRRVAVDVGAHVGLHTFWMRRDFDRVHAFEPVAVHRECFRLNVGSDRVVLYGCALGEEPGLVAMETEPTSSGDTMVGGAGDIPMSTLDSVGLTECDFIKLDCEGYELFALHGARDTLLEYRPAVMVEQKPGKAKNFGIGETDAVAFLESMGAKLRTVIAGDYLLSWD